MINSVRNTVLSVLNKNNYGYVSPSDFNLYAKQAQLEIFEDYFSKYNNQINLENSRLSGTDYAHLSKEMEEAMEIFSVTDYLFPTATLPTKFNLPSVIFNGNDYFMINKVVCYPIELLNGTNSSVSAGQLVDASATFITDGVAAGDVVVNDTTGDVTNVTSVISNTVLALDSNIFTVSPIPYYIYSAATTREAEKVTQGKITMLNNSLLTAPSIDYPAYTQEYSLMKVYPSTISRRGQVLANYFRYPFDPKWTFVTLTNGEPVFDQTQPDYQDFELPLEDEVRLIIKILQYCGISIREADVYTFAKTEQAQDDAK